MNKGRIEDHQGFYTKAGRTGGRNKNGKITIFHNLA